jgi:hypothetical protein
MIIQKIVLILLLIIKIESLTSSKAEAVVVDVDDEYSSLNYPKYSYKRTSETESQFRMISNRCEYKTECENIYSSMERLNCIHKCMSPICFKEIYASNPLEEGEIDQRYSSFKGCFALQLKS